MIRTRILLLLKLGNVTEEIKIRYYSTSTVQEKQKCRPKEDGRQPCIED
jgi:hypothetical protein